MQRLPFEILKNIFCSLKTRELLQCQLACKEWYEASVQLLYSKPIIDTDTKSRQYVRTISNSSRLGLYLDVINTRVLLKSKKDRRWDQHRLLDTIIQKCPNVTEIKSSDQAPEFWTRIMFAGSQGQLSRLSYLPDAKKEHLESYLCTALHLKRSLKRLSIHDEQYFEIDLHDMVLYQTLREQIREFANLQFLEIKIESHKYLSDFDKMIEDCPHLKEVSFCLYSFESVVPIDNAPLESIQPHPNIHKLEISWDMMRSKESEMKYIIQKFTKLQILKITRMTYHELIPIPTTNSYYQALIDFIHYTKAITNFEIEFDSRKDDFVNILKEFSNIDERFRDVEIGFFSDQLDNVDLTIGLNSSNIRLPVRRDDTELPHFNFITAFGSVIRSLELQDQDILPGELETVNGASLMESLTKLDWIYRTIRLCPLLQELKLNSSRYDTSPNLPTFQHTELKKLSIICDSIKNNLLCLPNMSLTFPNIKQLVLESDEDYFSNRNTRTIDMPDSSLDQITLKQFRLLSLDSTFHIRLDTEVGIKYFVCDKTKLAIPNGQDKVKKRLHIICKTLTKVLFINDSFSLEWVI